MKKKSIADNVDYVYPQISFLDDSGCVRKDCLSGSVLLCYICKKPIPRFHPTLYYLAAGKSKRICKVCYEYYRQHFDWFACRVKSKKGGK